MTNLVHSALSARADESSLPDVPSTTLPTRAIFALIVLMAAVSLTGILHPALYARETANWAAQAVGQDWVDLLFAVPWLALSAVAALRGSRKALLVLTGGLLYAAYEFVIYAFAVHFNRLFLAYCATLGLSLFCLVALVQKLWNADVRSWFRSDRSVRLPAFFLIAVGFVFVALWLLEIVPALVAGAPPASLVEAGIPTNPVHAMDLSVILPAHVAAGFLLLRRHPLGYLFAPVLLAFGALMALSIGGMLVVMWARNAGGSLAIAAGMAVLSALSGAVLLSLLRTLQPARR
jgi:hypothetical protein